MTPRRRCCVRVNIDMLVNDYTFYALDVFNRLSLALKHAIKKVREQEKEEFLSRKLLNVFVLWQHCQSLFKLKIVSQHPCSSAGRSPDLYFC